MIESIRIQNRQSHQDTTVDLHPGINVIVGRGTSGKSAIIRALRWPLENTTGTSQISRWIMREPKGKSKDLVLDGETAVTVTKPQGTLRRFRNPESNGYEVNGQTLKAVGTGVPEEVQGFFNLSDINIQGQHDAPFLISLPGSQVSAYLNRVVGIEEINTYMKAAAKCLKDARDKAVQLQEAQEADQKALEALSWVDGVHKSIAVLDILEAAKVSTESKLQRVSDLVASIRHERAKASVAARVSALEPQFLEAKKTAQGLQGTGTRLSQVSRLVGAWKESVEARERASKVSRLSSALDAVRGLGEDLTAKAYRLNDLEIWMKRMRTTEESLAVASKVAGLAGSLSACKAVALEISTKTTGIYNLQAWASSLRTVKESLTVAGKLAALEPLVSKVRKTARVLEVRKGELESLEDWGLTMQGHQSRLEAKRSEVSALEAKRPETCPLCGGGYGKEKCLGTP